MDLNLTGAIAANASLMPPSKTDYLALIIQTIFALAVALGATYIAHNFNIKSTDREHVLKARDDVYYEFLDVAFRDKYGIDDANVSAAKMQIYGSEEMIWAIKTIFVPEYEKVEQGTGSIETLRNRVVNEIIPILRKELQRRKRHWWQFWR